MVSGNRILACLGVVQLIGLHASCSSDRALVQHATGRSNPTDSATTAQPSTDSSSREVSPEAGASSETTMDAGGAATSVVPSSTVSSGDAAPTTTPLPAATSSTDLLDASADAAVVDASADGSADDALCRQTCAQSANLPCRSEHCYDYCMDDLAGMCAESSRALSTCTSNRDPSEFSCDEDNQIVGPPACGEERGAFIDCLFARLERAR